MCACSLCERLRLRGVTLFSRLGHAEKVERGELLFLQKLIDAAETFADLAAAKLVDDPTSSWLFAVM